MKIPFWKRLQMQWVIGQLVKNPTKTDLVFKYFDLVMNLDESIVSVHFKRMYKRNPIESDFQQVYFAKEIMQKMLVDDWPENSFGSASKEFFACNGLDVEFYPNIYQKDPSPRTYIIQRFYQAHDLWHVLLGVDTEPIDEMVVLAFTAGQILTPSAIDISFAAYLHTIQATPTWSVELFETLVKAFQLGRTCPSLLEAKPELGFNKPLSEVRGELGLPVDGFKFAKSPSP